MLTGTLGGARRRRAANDDQQNQRLQFSSRSTTQLYQELAQASGGQAIQVTKADLPQATSIIEDTTSSALVMSQDIAGGFSNIAIVHFILARIVSGSPSYALIPFFCTNAASF